MLLGDNFVYVSFIPFQFILLKVIIFEIFHDLENLWNLFAAGFVY